MPTDTIILNKGDVKITPDKPVNGRGFAYIGRAFEGLHIDAVVIEGKARLKKKKQR